MFTSTASEIKFAVRPRLLDVHETEGQRINYTFRENSFLLTRSATYLKIFEAAELDGDYFLWHHWHIWTCVSWVTEPTIEGIQSHLFFNISIATACKSQLPSVFAEVL